MPAPPSTVTLISAARVAGGGKHVVAAAGPDNEVFGGAYIERERRRAEPIEPHAAAVRGDREHLGAVAGIDLGGVVTIAAFHQVGAFARIPDHAIITGLAERLVVAGGRRSSTSLPSPPNNWSLPPLPSSVSFPEPPEQQIVAGTAGELVIAVATEQ